NRPSGFSPAFWRRMRWSRTPARRRSSSAQISTWQASSLVTLRWREVDSNPRSPVSCQRPESRPRALVAPSRAGPETQQQTLRLWWLSWIRIDEQAVRRIGFRRPEPRIEAEPRPAIGAENRVLLAHVDVDVRVIERRRNADAV